MNRAALTAVLSIAATATAFAAGTSASATGTAQVKIRKAITISNTAALDFGGLVVAAGSGSDTATVSAAGAFSNTSAGGSIVGTFNTAAAAAFQVNGTKGATYAITLPGAASTLNGSNGGTLSVGTFTGSKATGTLSLAAGQDTFTVGATLTVPNNAVDGDYTGTFSVTVAYN